MLDRSRLIKILGMTGSEHDGEALAAIRRASAILREAKVTWGELLTGGGGSQIGPLLATIASLRLQVKDLEAKLAVARRPMPEPPRKHPAAPDKKGGFKFRDHAEFDRIFEYLDEHDEFLRESTRRFVSSLSDQYGQTGSLSPRQVDALRRVYTGLQADLGGCHG